MRPLSIALVHFPVLGSKGEIVTSAITNLDIHDLARSARTYGAAPYFIVHPIIEQRALVEKICDHWQHGSSGRRIPPRKLALELVRVTTSLEETYETMGGRNAIEVWGTAARSVGQEVVSFASGREQLAGDGKPVLLLFGTSWGLHPDTLGSCDKLLEPIKSGTPYNHLSVRSACAIALDRLLGSH